MWMGVTPALTFVIIIASFYGLGANGITYIRWNPTTVSSIRYLLSYHQSFFSKKLLLNIKDTKRILLYDYP